MGNPVRAAVLERAGAGYIPPGDYPMSILVIGGSQGARILSDVVPPAIAALPMEILRNIRVSHQARDEDHDRVAGFYAEHGIDADVQPFFHDVPRRMSEAQLVISRVGRVIGGGYQRDWPPVDPDPLSPRLPAIIRPPTRAGWSMRGRRS